MNTNVKATKTSEKAPHEQTSDSLADCFQQLLSVYGIHADIENLRADTIHKPGLLEPDDLQLLAKKLNINVTIKKRPFGDLKKRSTPALVLLNGKEAILTIPAPDKSMKIYEPGQGLTEGSVDKYQDNYFGYIVTIERKSTGGGAETEHMWQAKTIDWFWRPLFSFWPNYVEIIVCSLFINIFAIALPLFTLNVYDRVVPNFAEPTLIVLTIGIVVALLFDFLLKTMRTYILERVAAKVSVKFDGDLLERFLAIPPLSLPMTVGEKTNIFREMQTIRDFYASRLAPAFVDLPFFLLFVGVIYLINPSLAVVPLIGGVLMVAVNLLVQIPVNQITQRYFRDMQSKSAALVDLLNGLSTIRLFNAQNSHLFRWNTTTEKASESARKTQFVIAAAHNFSLMILYFVNIFIVFLGVYEIEAERLTVGGLIAATILSSRAVAPIMGVAGVASRWKQSKDVLKTIDSLFKIPTENDGEKSYESKGDMKGKIELRDISFFYPNSALPAVKDVSMILEPGEKVGFIGKTGAGKTTLSRVCAGNFVPQQGEVLVDDYAVNTIHPAELRRNIGIVPQRSHFFAGSIRDNVLLGDENLTENDFHKATTLSGLDLFVQQTGQGYDAPVGEDGSQLSGGQQQAIALARVIIRDPQIIILDEPTTGMDKTLEERIKHGLIKFLRDKTFIMVTHRTSLLSLVDRLVLLDKGRVVADGPREQIIQKLSGKG